MKVLGIIFIVATGFVLLRIRQYTVIQTGTSQTRSFPAEFRNLETPSISRELSRDQNYQAGLVSVNCSNNRKSMFFLHKTVL